tara:strand:- start:1691 stop:2161 length:471 start_codon:yes stop_codon:yes gene_type:complete
MIEYQEIWTDGACINNGAPDAKGGMGIFSPKSGIHVSAPWEESGIPTNQKCELLAVIIAVEMTEGPIIIRTDSEYVVRGFNEWLSDWKVRGWKTSRRRDLKNSKLWKRLDYITKNRDVILTHVRGHSGIEENEVADQYAYAGAVKHKIKEKPSISG